MHNRILRDAANVSIRSNTEINEVSYICLCTFNDRVRKVISLVNVRNRNPFSAVMDFITQLQPYQHADNTGVYFHNE